MLLPSTNVEDGYMWSFTKDGMYSSKSGYRVLCDGYNRDIPDAGWSRLWKLNIPPKIKMFVWKLASGCVATRQRLAGRGMSIPTHCPFCHTDIEHDYHLFIRCIYVQECWNLSGINTDVFQLDYLTSSILQVMVSLNEVDLTKLAMTLWVIWNQRNQLVWDSKLQLPEVAISLASNYLAAWRLEKTKAPAPPSLLRGPIIENGVRLAAVRNEQIRPALVPPVTAPPLPIANTAAVSSLSGPAAGAVQTRERRWIRPPSGTIKCNCDASSFRNEARSGIGALLHSSDGSFMACRTVCSRSSTISGRLKR
ncbi:uncharacterized protein [Euphorbia lathyris]|uniref:uncharacterized protein n=1 Tax=Euphorbia lathyris TaxID=212925 RepID=UPI0033142D19